MKDMHITRSGAQPSQRGPAEWFTGTVRIDPLFAATDPPRASGSYVTFEPGARSAWHTHPLGQVLIVTAGVGRVQRWGGPVEEIRAGDVVWTPPGVKHWHGASPTTAMTHLAITEQLDGKAVEWMEKVTDEQYGAAVKPATGTPPGAAADVGGAAPALARYGDVGDAHPARVLRGVAERPLGDAGREGGVREAWQAVTPGRHEREERTRTERGP